MDSNRANSALTSSPARPSLQDIEQKLETLVSARGANKTICPSEVARALTSDWRVEMPRVRGVACDLATQGRVSILQRGNVIPLDQLQYMRGPIRIGMPRIDGI